MRVYLVTAVKAEGGGLGLYRVYFSDGTTFARTYIEYKSDNLLYGPTAGLKRVPNIPGYNWYRRSGESESGNMIAIEPVYIVRKQDPEKLWWKTSITNKDYAGVSGVVVGDAARPDNLKIFTSRASFETWLRGSVEPDVLSVDDTGKQGGGVTTREDVSLERIEKLLTEAQKILRSLKNKEK